MTEKNNSGKVECRAFGCEIWPIGTVDIVRTSCNLQEWFQTCWRDSVKPLHFSQSMSLSYLIDKRLLMFLVS